MAVLTRRELANGSRAQECDKSCLHNTSFVSQSRLTMSMHALPLELVSLIISFALHNNPRTTNVLLVNSVFYKHGLVSLHSNLKFTTTDQLSSFVDRVECLSAYPRSLTVTLAGGAADFRLFHLLQVVFRRCAEFQVARDEEGVEADGRLRLKQLRFCFHSHTSDPNLHRIYHALVLTE